jgi:peptidoglycan/LPS O-acetylase OafA/YrhL
VTSASETPVALRGEVRPLTGLRIVAALWVVCFHFSFTPGDAYTAVWAPLRPLVQTGALGVDLFYVLSGFVITLTYLDKLGPRPSVRGAVAFWWARICRVWPVYALVTTVFGGWLLYKQTRVTDGFLVWQTVQPQVDGWAWLEQLAMVQLWHRPYADGSSWVGPAWSISAEWAAYVCFPLLALGLWRVRRAPVLVTGVLAVACMVPFAYVCWTTGNPYYSWSWLVRIGCGFLAGALTCMTVRRIRVTPRVESVAAAVAVLAVVEILIGVWWGWWRGQGADEYGGVVVLVFPVLVGALSISRRGLSRVLSTGPMVHGGRISYSLYLVHVAVFEVFWTYMGWSPRIAPGSALGTFLVPHLLLVVLLLAHLSYRYVEEPSRLWLRSRGPGRWSRRDRTAAGVLATGTRDGVPGTTGQGTVGVPAGAAADGGGRPQREAREPHVPARRSTPVPDGGRGA